MQTCKKVPLKTTLLHRPQVRDKVDGPIKKPLQPSNAIGRYSKLTFSRTNQPRENKGDSQKISRPISTSGNNNSSTPTSFNSKSRRTIPNGKRLRKTSIPRPTSLANLRKNPQITASNSTTEVHPCKVLDSTYNIQSSSIVDPEPSSIATAKVIQSTPKKPLVTETPNRRRSVATTTPSQTKELVDQTPVIRPSFRYTHLSTIVMPYYIPSLTGPPNLISHLVRGGFIDEYFVNRTTP